jgi:hypothetical protein
MILVTSRYLLMSLIVCPCLCWLKCFLGMGTCCSLLEGLDDSGDTSAVTQEERRSPHGSLLLHLHSVKQSTVVRSVRGAIRRSNGEMAEGQHIRLYFYYPNWSQVVLAAKMPDNEQPVYYVHDSNAYYTTKARARYTTFAIDELSYHRTSCRVIRLNC